MIETLSASGPHPDHADALMLFGQFVGTWDMHVRDLPPGEEREYDAVWEFGWVLDGRAVQDVLVAPGIEYGSTLRAYDPDADAWNIVWTTPVNNRMTRLTARAEGDRIVLAGEQRRWSFEEITPDSFVWRGEIPLDDGATYELVEEMHARRRS